MQVTYHKLVKTTPNPSATKNRRGELVAEPPVGSPLPPVVVAALLEDEAVDGGISKVQWGSYEFFEYANWEFPGDDGISVSSRLIDHSFERRRYSGESVSRQTPKHSV